MISTPNVRQALIFSKSSSPQAFTKTSDIGVLDSLGFLIVLSLSWFKVLVSAAAGPGGGGGALGAMI